MRFFHLRGFLVLSSNGNACLSHCCEGGAYTVRVRRILGEMWELMIGAPFDS